MKQKLSYVPSQKKLEKYADILVNFALGSEKGIKKGDVVRVTISEVAKPLLFEIRKAITKAGGHMIANYLPTPTDRRSLAREFYEIASDDQLTFYPAQYIKGVINTVDHTLTIISNTDPHELKAIDPRRLMMSQQVNRKTVDLIFNKEKQGNLTWCGALYGTEGMAKEAGLTLKEYWKQIEYACFLDKEDPIQEFRTLFNTLRKHARALNKITAQTEKFHVLGPDVDLWITPGEERQWICGSGRNIPSFEIFTSPDWRGTHGWIRFSQPVYRGGMLIDGMELWFENGVVTKSKAKKNQKAFQQMIATENADKIGEFSLTDKRYSRITKFMANTLYDENVGGKYGNSHIAIGFAYDNSWTGDTSKMTPAIRNKLGFNKSTVHTDLVTTTDRAVTAYLKNGKTKVIYKDGMYQV